MCARMLDSDVTNPVVVKIMPQCCSSLLVHVLTLSTHCVSPHEPGICMISARLLDSDVTNPVVLEGPDSSDYSLGDNVVVCHE